MCLTCSYIVFYQVQPRLELIVSWTLKQIPKRFIDNVAKTTKVLGYVVQWFRYVKSKFEYDAGQNAIAMPSLITQCVIVDTDRLIYVIMNIYN